MHLHRPYFLPSPLTQLRSEELSGMSDSPPTSKSIKTSLRDEINKLPLTRQEKAEIAPKLEEYVRFLDTDGGGKKGGKMRADSGVFGFVERVNTVAARFSAEGLSVSQYLSAALKQPSLFMQSPATVEGN